MNMRLLGARSIDDLVPEMVDASALNQHIVTVPQDNLFQATCEPSAPLATVDDQRANHFCRPTAADYSAQGQQAIDGLYRKLLDRCDSTALYK
jgi:hypothetical protein